MEDAGTAKQYKKKEILETLSILERANDAVVRTAKISPDDAAKTLVSCQESAILIGTYVESLGADYDSLVKSLEDYCENIFRMSEAMPDESQCRKIAKKIQKQLNQIRHGVTYDLPDDRKEVVFLPYKASMWDSLESVWRAADADPDCDAYVIPIPYFDKNPDGSFREEHYEGDLYPKDVPITRYDEYDLEARHPDIIYIHNPYDGCNHVTSVHPYFYSKNLRNFTDKLVYIPYFILGEIEPDNQADIDGMKHFCFTPGTIYADQVVVQSENMRQIYINEYMKAAEEMGLGGEHVDRKFLEKKFLGTGSPKIDKVLNTKKEDLEIPEEWLKIIEKPDGNWKKIVFYNTSVSALLQYNEAMLRKMKSVFEMFKDNKDEVALLWRPHPLIQATIESMRPQLWEGYKEIRDRYIEEEWGIYDDSAELDRAVVISDGYYGDGSSVVQLCQKVGMPVLLQNVHSLLENNYSLAMDNIAEHQGEWWFLALKDNCIYRMNKKTFEATLVGRIPWDEHGWMQQYGKIYIYKNKIFIIPWAPIKIAVYDIKDQGLYYLDYEKETANRGMVFSEGIIDGHKLYLVPCAYRNILCIDMDTEEIEYIRLDETLSEKGQKHLYAWGSVFYDKKTVYMTMLDSNKILCLGLQSGKLDVYQDELLLGGCAGICGDENSIWIVPKVADKIIHWNREQQTVDIIEDFPPGYQPGNFSFHKIKICGEYLYLLPRDANMGVMLNRKKNKISCWKMEESITDVKNFYDRYLRYANVWDEQENTYLIRARNGKIARINEKNGKLEQEVKQIRILENGAERIPLCGNQERENRFDDLKNFIVMLRDI